MYDGYEKFAARQNRPPGALGGASSTSPPRHSGEISLVVVESAVAVVRIVVELRVVLESVAVVIVGDVSVAACILVLEMRSLVVLVMVSAVAAVGAVEPTVDAIVGPAVAAGSILHPQVTGHTA